MLYKGALAAAIGMSAASQIAAGIPADAAPVRGRIAITDVAIIDLARGKSTRPRTVLIEDGRIVAISAGKTARIPADAQIVDGRGKFLMAGLVDMHVHLFNTYSGRAPNEWTFPLFIANGVTAVREMAAHPASMAVVRQWRTQADNGKKLMPRIVAVGMPAKGKSVAEALRQVSDAHAAGADFIKVFSDVPGDHWQAIMQAANRHALPVAGHVPAEVALLEAAAAGQRSNEHLMQAYEACSSIDAVIRQERRGLAGTTGNTAASEAQEVRVLDSFNPRVCKRVARLLAKTGQAQVPTLVLGLQRTGPAADADPRWRYLRPDERTRWTRVLRNITQQTDVLEDKRWRAGSRIVALMQKAGVPLLTGTDAPMPLVYPGFSMHEELRLLVRAGLSTQAALRAATIAPAQFLGIADVSGSVAKGKRADLLLLDADPVKAIGNTRLIHAVILDGRLLRRAALDDMLEKAALQARELSPPTGLPPLPPG